MLLPHPITTLFPYTTLFRSGELVPHPPRADVSRKTKERCLRGCRSERNPGHRGEDRKSTRLNSSHLVISYAVYCLKKKTKHIVIKDYMDCSHYFYDD